MVCLEIGLNDGRRGEREGELLILSRIEHTVLPQALSSGRWLPTLFLLDNSQSVLQFSI